jgi:hypothetical protein
MRRNLFFVLLLLACFGEAKSQVLLTEGFEGSTFPPTGWTRINAGSGFDWKASDDASFTDGPYTFHHGGTKSMVCEYNASNASNAWMITPSITAVTGGVYQVTFWYRIRSATYPEKMKVTVGNAATVAAQTSTLWNNNGLASLTNTTYAQGTIYYTATANGNIYFGFNCYSDANQWAMIVDDIQVEKLSDCAGAPTAGTATGPTQACAGMRIALSATGQTPLLGGISYKWQTTTIGGSSWTDVPGATAPSSTAVQPAGGADYRFVTICSNSTSANSNVVSVASQSTSCPPANDDYCGAIALTLNGAEQCGNTTTATSVGDPAFTSSTPNNTLWYKYTPAVTGQVNIVMSRPTGVTTGLLNAWVGIYSASGTCPALTTFVQQTATTGYDLTTNPTVTVASPTLTAGTTYYLMIDGNTGSTGQYCIKIEGAVVPPCVANISPANNATNVAYLPNLAMSWNASAGAASYDLYISTVNPPPTNAPINVTTTSTTLTGGAPSTTYYWYVVPKTAAGINAVGCTTNITSFTTAAAPAPPANNECATAVAISQYTGPVSGTTVSATQSQAAEVCATFTSSAANDVWYKFTALFNGNATIAVTNPATAFDAVIQCYSGACGSLVSIGCADATTEGGNETANLTGLVAGQTYYLRVYNFAGTTSADGSFTIGITGTAVPVSIADFKGVRQASNNMLSWTTATEINNAGFELQRSVDGVNFSSLVFVASKAANGNSNGSLNYSFNDKITLAASYYYRLKQIDKDGRPTLSSVVFIKGTKATKFEMVSIYPNPAISDLNVSIASPKSDWVTFVVSDLAGKVIIRQSANVVSGDNNIKLNVSSLAKGTYTVKAVCADGCETAISKFIKQ